MGWLIKGSRRCSQQPDCLNNLAGVFIEKGMGLVLPGLTTDVLGEVYGYSPSVNELLVGVGVWAIGALLFTLMIRVTGSITSGQLRARMA